MVLKFAPVAPTVKVTWARLDEGMRAITARAANIQRTRPTFKVTARLSMS